MEQEILEGISLQVDLMVDSVVLEAGIADLMSIFILHFGELILCLIKCNHRFKKLLFYFLANIIFKIINVYMKNNIMKNSNQT